MRKRFFRAAMISISAGLLIAFVFAIPLMEQVYEDELEQVLSTALVFSQEYDISEENCRELAQRLVGYLNEEGLPLRVTIFAESGNVMGDTCSTGEPPKQELPPEVDDALASGKGKAVRKSDISGEKAIYLAKRMVNTQGSVFILRVSLPLKGFGRTQVMLWCCAGIGIFMGLIVALFTAHYSAGRLMEPIYGMVKAARSIADGNTSVHVEEAPDELGELSGAFNRMADRLTQAHEKLEKSNQQLAGILQGMDDGVIAMKANGELSMMTRRARELLGSCPATVRYLKECGPYYQHIASLMQQAQLERHPIRDTLFLTDNPSSEKILQIYAVQVDSLGDGDILAVVSDVTRIHKLESMRREFVANVTHELKTPLTSIRGYIELLKSGQRDEDMAQSFYEIIEIEAERLQKLTDDLLQLSEIENGELETDIPATSFHEIVERVDDTLRPEAEKRGITLTENIEAGLQWPIHPRRLYQLLKNLMENAIKYNRDRGDVEVSVRIEKTGNNEMPVCYITVKDTGIGIPKEHIDRIFERFYRVDKTRSREQGGTGLGLSIVKHIVTLYKGSISVESNDRGSTFTITLPCLSMRE